MQNVKHVLTCTIQARALNDKERFSSNESHSSRICTYSLEESQKLCESHIRPGFYDVGRDLITILQYCDCIFTLKSLDVVTKHGVN